MDLETEVVFTTPFKCHSWRHEGDCSRWANAQAFCRIRDAVKAHETPPVYMVITVDPKRYSGRSGAYRALHRAFTRFKQRLEYRVGRIDYCSLVEEHQSGYPHMNLLIHNYPMFDMVSSEMDLPAQKRPFKRWIEESLEVSGLGSVCWMEPVESEEAIAGYFCKLIAETAKVLQLPVSAPDGFRRLRASRGYLPMTHAQERRLKGGRTGGLLKFPKESVEVSGRISLTESRSRRIIGGVHTLCGVCHAERRNSRHVPILRGEYPHGVDLPEPAVPCLGVEAEVRSGFDKDASEVLTQGHGVGIPRAVRSHEKSSACRVGRTIR
jgi:hypothetical protein